MFYTSVAILCEVNCYLSTDASRSADDKGDGLFMSHVSLVFES